MKTKCKFFLLLCLFLGLVTVKLFAQGTRTYPFIEPIEGNTYDISILCDDVEVDVVNFPLYFELRIRHHYKNEELIWEKYQLSNTQYTSKITGEVFKALDVENLYEKGEFIWRMNLNGNMGNHYIIKMVFDTTTWEMTDIQSNCH